MEISKEQLWDKGMKLYEHLVEMSKKKPLKIVLDKKEFKEYVDIVYDSRMVGLMKEVGGMRRWKKIGVEKREILKTGKGAWFRCIPVERLK